MNLPQIETAKLKCYFKFIGLFLALIWHGNAYSQGVESNSQYFLTIKNTIGDKVENVLVLNQIKGETKELGLSNKEGLVEF